MASRAGAGFGGAALTTTGCILSSRQIVLFTVPVTDFLIDRSGTAIVISLGVAALDEPELGDNPTSLQIQEEAVSSQNPQLAKYGFEGRMVAGSADLRPMSLQMQDVDAVSSQRPHEVSAVAVVAGAIELVPM